MKLLNVNEKGLKILFSKKIICLFVILSLINIVYAQEDEAPDWPEEGGWIPTVQYQNKSVDVRSLIGDAATPGGLYYFFHYPNDSQPDAYLYIRIRLDEEPTEELEPMGWAVEIDTSGDLTDMEYYIQIEPLSENKVKIKLNNESIKAIGEGESDTLSDGTEIGVIELAKAVSELLDERAVVIKKNLDKIDLSEVPGTLRFILGKPKINIEVNGEVYGFKIAGNKIKEFVEGGIDNPHYLIIVPENVLEEIIKSEDPISAVEEKYLEGEIIVEPQRVGAKIKFWFLEKFIGWFIEEEEDIK